MKIRKGYKNVVLGYIEVVCNKCFFFNRYGFGFFFSRIYVDYLGGSLNLYLLKERCLLYIVFI